MKCPHYQLSSCKPPRWSISLPIFLVSQKRRLPTVANVDSHRFWSHHIQSMGGRWKWNPLNGNSSLPKGSAAQSSAAQSKAAQSHQSRQGPRILQEKRLQCKSSFHLPHHTHTHPSGADRGCADFPTHLAPIHSGSARALGGYAWHWPGGPGRPEKDELTVLLHLYMVAESLSLLLFKNLFL